MHPFFVTIEGIDGAGKDTLAAGLRNHFAERHGFAVIVTEEPSNDPIGRSIREMLERKRPAPPTNYEFQRLFVENRREHLSSCIRPALEAGQWVISVRYWLSTLAYGMLEGPMEPYLELHREILGAEMLYPDLALVLDVDAEEGLRRIQAAGRHFDWFAKLEKLEKIRQNYLELAGRTDLGLMAVIDAMHPRAQVLREAETLIEKHYLEKTLSQMQPTA